MKLLLTSIFLFLLHVAFSQTELQNRPAQYVKGASAWKRFLEQSTTSRTIDSCLHNTKDSLYYKNLKMSFNVKPDSTIDNIHVFHGTDESLCLTLAFSQILKGSYWLPALVNGKPYTSLVEQSITICQTDE